MNNSLEEKLCSRCNCPVNSCWLFCPYCGAKIPGDTADILWGTCPIASWLMFLDDSEPSIIAFPSISRRPT